MFCVAAIFAVLYILFNIYLVIHMCASMGNRWCLQSRVSYIVALTLKFNTCLTFVVGFSVQLVQEWVLPSDNTFMINDSFGEYAR